MGAHLRDVSILLLPVLERLLQVLLPQSLDGSNLELVVRQQLSEFLWGNTQRARHADAIWTKAELSAALLWTLTGLLIGPAPLLAQATQPLQQPGVLCLQLLDQALGGALVDHGSVLNALCPVGDYSLGLKWQWRDSPTPCSIVPLGIAQGGQRLLVADVRWAQSGNLSNAIKRHNQKRDERGKTLGSLFEPSRCDCFLPVQTAAAW